MPSNRIKRNICKFILLLVALSAMQFNSVYAANEAKVLQAYISEQTLTVFTDVELVADGLKCAVSNQNAEIARFGLLSDESALTKTTVLIDVSTSMPNSVRDGVIATLNKMIESKSANEEIKIVVFGDEISVLQNFSSDRYDLANAISKIKFDGTQSKIYDAIYNNIPRITLSESKATFYRTIVFTDGVDNAVSGITKEELFLKLQNERYPVDVIAVSGGETVEDRELSAIVRMSGGRYFSLIPKTDPTVLAQSLGVSNFFYFEAIVPAALLDGTTRQVDISSGISIDVKFPVFNAPIIDTQPTNTESEASVVKNPEPTAAPDTVTSSPYNGTDASKSVANLFGEYTIVVYVGVGIALLIVIAIIIAVTVTRGKKKKKNPRSEPIISSGYGTNSYADKTEFVGDVSYSDSQYTIKLSNTNDPSKTWTLPVTGDLLIGRAEHCPIQFDDKSVSREQCKIMVQGSGLVVAHMGSTNKTSLNGSNVVGNSPIQSGDTLKFGRVVLRIDYIQALGNPPPRQDMQQNQGSGKTESIF